MGDRQFNRTEFGVALIATIALPVALGVAELTQPNPIHPFNNWWIRIAAGITLIGFCFIVFEIVAWFRSRRSAKSIDQAPAAEPALSISIGGVVLIGSGTPTRIQVAVTVRSEGSPTTLRGWRVRVRLGDSTTDGVHLPGFPKQPEINPDLTALDAATGTSAFAGEISGYVTFVVNMDRGRLDDAIDAEPLFEITVLVSDQDSKEWAGTRDVKELAAEGRMSNTITSAKPVNIERVKAQSEVFVDGVNALLADYHSATHRELFKKQADYGKASSRLSTKLMNDFRNAYSSDALWLHDQYQTLGITDGSERFSFEHPTNPLGVEAAALLVGLWMRDLG